jgi:hypothetical protein
VETLFLETLLKTRKGLLKGVPGIALTTTTGTHRQSNQSNQSNQYDQYDQYDRLDHTMDIIRRLGSVKQQGVQQSVTGTSPSRGAHFDLQALFKYVDDDGSGRISRDEFLNVFVALIPGIAHQQHEHDPKHQSLVTKVG